MIEFDYITNDKIDVNQLNNLLLRFNFKLNNIINVKPKDKFLLVIKTGVICLNNVFSNSDLQKQIKYIKSEIDRSNLILSNKNFILKAPKEKVLQEKNKLNSYLEKYKILLSLLPKK
jgi:valyl-tRNA synthetase